MVNIKTRELIDLYEEIEANHQQFEPGDQGSILLITKRFK